MTIRFVFSKAVESEIVKNELRDQVAGADVTAGWRLIVECCAHDPREQAIREAAAQIRDWSTVLALAEDHGVLAQLARRLQEYREMSRSAGFDRELKERRRSWIAAGMMRAAELFRSLDVLGEAQVAVLAVKGPELAARAYGDACARQYTDLDLLALHAEIPRATQALTAAGYTASIPAVAIEAGKIPGEYRFIRNGSGIPIEMHTERTLRYFPQSAPLRDFFEAQVTVAFDNRHVPALSAADELLFLCVHGAKDFWARLLWIADIAALLASNPQLDGARLARMAQLAGAERMLHVGLRLASDLLRAELPEALRQRVEADRAAAPFSAEIQQWLASPGPMTSGLFNRAQFRMRLAGGSISGVRFLTRLLFSPTQEDWAADGAAGLPSVMAAACRPLRLSKKYGRSSKT